MLPADPHLPGAHLRPPRNWINDPNGLTFHDGHYHVCYQYNPNGSHHADMHWGHFRSQDLLHWEELPIALTPTPGGEDADGCFSGNAVSTGDRLVAFYSGHRTDRWSQPVTSAESLDGGRTFKPRGALLFPAPAEGVTMFRDPYVWRQDGQWRMLVGAALADGRAAALQYRSDDLEHWEDLGPFLARRPEPVPGGDTEEGWECPQFAHFGDGRGVLILSAWDPDGGPARVVAYPGTEDGSGFTVGAPVRLDHGPDFYAPALLPAPDGRWLLWGWSWEARDPAWVKESGWAGVLTVPRELTLGPDGAVRQQPARELLALRGRQLIAGSALGEVGLSFDLTARLTPTGSGPAGLRLVTSADGTEHLDLVLADRQLTLDREHASLDPRAHRGRYQLPCPDGPVELRLIVDHSIAELYLSTGESLTLRCYPTGEAPWRIEAFGALEHQVEAWELRPITRRSV